MYACVHECVRVSTSVYGCVYSGVYLCVQRCVRVCTDVAYLPAERPTCVRGVRACVRARAMRGTYRAAACQEARDTR